MKFTFLMTTCRQDLGCHPVSITIRNNEEMQSKTWCVYLDISCIPLLRKLNFNTELVWPSKVLTHARSDKAHILIVESADDVATHWSTGENRTHQMPLLWPRKVPTAEPSLTSQIYRTMKHHILKLYHPKLCSATVVLMLQQLLLLLSSYCILEVCFPFQLLPTVTVTAHNYFAAHLPLQFCLVNQWLEVCHLVKLWWSLHPAKCKEEQ